jgi:predicted dehydrogenase
MTELRAGIIGGGFSGRIQARSVRLAGGRLVGVAASNLERAEALAGELGADSAFATGEELAASEAVDVVHICAPNHLHLPLARAALGAGKHVVCEKPIALDATEAAELVAIAEAAGTVVTVPFVYRYYPTVREARARIAAGAVGELRMLQGGYLQDWLLAADDSNWRVDPGLGGRSRAFADIGSHLCDLIEFVSGERIASLTARIATAYPARGATEDLATMMFETRNGVLGSAAISQVAAGRKNRLWFELSGSERSLAFEQERPETLWVGSRAGAELIPGGSPELSNDASRYVTLPAGHPQGYQHCFDAFVAETYAAIRGEPPAEGLPAIADGARAVQLTEAVLRSAEKRTWVEPGA